MNPFASLLADVRACIICAVHLPHGVRPILQIHPQARVLKEYCGRIGVPRTDSCPESFALHTNSYTRNEERHTTPRLGTALKLSGWAYSFRQTIPTPAGPGIAATRLFPLKLDDTRWETTVKEFFAR